MYKILAMADFSAASDHAIVFAQLLLANTVADFHLVHTSASPPNDRTNGGFTQTGTSQSVAKLLLSLKFTLQQQSIQATHTYHTRLISGNTEQAIEDLLSQEPFDLIVIGPTYSGKHGFFGNLATEMIRNAKANVLIVPHIASIQPLRQILFAVDYLSIRSTQSFALLNELARQKSVQLTLLTIVHPYKPGTQPSEQSRNFVQKALHPFDMDVYTIHDANPQHGLLTYLDLHQVDLLVMIPHHKSFFDLLANKSLTRSMVFSLTVPLLTLYDPGTP